MIYLCCFDKHASNLYWSLSSCYYGDMIRGLIFHMQINFL